MLIAEPRRGPGWFRPEVAARRPDNAGEIIECFHRRSLRYGEEALDLAGEAVEIGFENRWTQAGGKLAHGIAAPPHRADRMKRS